MAPSLSIIIFMLIIPFTSHASCIQQYLLNERNIYQVPIGVESPTTIMFPGKIMAISGANITTDPTQKAPALLSYKEGMPFFSIKALEPHAKAAANIVYNNKTYVLSFYSEVPSARSVKFYDHTLSQAFSQSFSNPPSVSPENLLSLLDRAKNYSTLQYQYDKTDTLEVEHPGTLTFYKDYDVQVEEVFRFSLEDTLVFRLKLTNKTEHAIYYQPQSLAARVGHSLYYASIADASGIIPPLAGSTAYFAITGKPGGARSDLSVRNHFQIIVMQVEDISLVVPGKC